MPQGVLTAPFVALTSSASLTTIGSRMPAVRLPNTLTAGCRFAPFRIPLDMDTSRTSTIAFNWQLEADSPGSATNIVTQLRYTYSVSGTPSNESSVPKIPGIPIPPLLGAGTNLFLDYTRTGMDHSLPGGYLTPETVLGFQLDRVAGSGADTYEHNMLVAASLWFFYYIRCQRVCCP